MQDKLSVKEYEDPFKGQGLEPASRVIRFTGRATAGLMQGVLRVGCFTTCDCSQIKMWDNQYFGKEDVYTKDFSPLMQAHYAAKW